ncbi:SDR family oxidoreductase [Virgibacillus siamensis]|uniref:SDR family oxidoreductase n=1 Tax=Virgibacillus siamensis TaxID=480071 RepID=UPI00098791AF|nr:SDR family oxidoreductase [Virgibacillus siamensis]
MANKLSGKTAVITGASSGIGSAIAAHLAEEGANVVLAARRKDKLDELVDSINKKGNGKAIAVETDVTNKGEVDFLAEKTADTFGEVDIYINNAGLMLLSKVQNGHVDEWDRMVDVNIKGVLYGINSVLPKMLERKTGHLVNVASVAGLEVSKVNAVYSATKFAVRALSMGLEKELARTGVRVTNISPGAVDTDLATHGTDEELIGKVKENNRKLKADDIARAVVYAVTQPDYVNVNEVTVRPV